MVEKAPEAFRTISEVANDLDLPQHVLRFWETRFQQIKPLKRGGGRRYYRPDDIDLLRGIRHLLYSEGYTIRGAQRILKDHGIKFVQNVWRAGAPQPARASEAVEPEIAEAPPLRPQPRDARRGRRRLRAPPPVRPACRRSSAATPTRSVSRRAAAPTPRHDDSAVAVGAADERAGRSAGRRACASCRTRLRELQECRQLLDAAVTEAVPPPERAATLPPFTRVAPAPHDDTDDTNSASPRYADDTARPHNALGNEWPRQKSPKQGPKQSSAEREMGDRAEARAQPSHRACGGGRAALCARALESINQGVYDWDIVKGTVYYSPLLRSIFGMSEDMTLTPAESGARIHPDDLEQYRTAITDHLKGATPRLLVEYRYLANDNTWRWARQSGIAQRGPDGNAIRMVGATSDITDDEAARADLAAARAEIESTRENMRTVLENMNDGIVLIDKDFVWKFGNEQFNKFLHVPAEITKPGTSCYDVIRYQALRGDFGPTDDIEKAVQERADMMRTPGGYRYERQTRSGLLHRVHLQAARRREPARRLPRHHRVEASARASRPMPEPKPKWRLPKPSASAPRRKPPIRRSPRSSPP